MRETVKHVQENEQGIVLLIDGQCFLCHGVTKFVLKRDPHARFRFATLQSPYGQSMLAREGFDPEQRDTFFMLDGDRVFTKSDAALRVLKRLGGGWRLCYGAIIVPRFIRDAVYQFIARNRYRWFGQSDQCMIPEAGWKERWVEGGWEDGRSKDNWKLD